MIIKVSQLLSKDDQGAMDILEKYTRQRNEKKILLYLRKLRINKDLLDVFEKLFLSILTKNI